MQATNQRNNKNKIWHLSYLEYEDPENCEEWSGYTRGKIYEIFTFKNAKKYLHVDKIY